MHHDLSAFEESAMASGSAVSPFYDLLEPAVAYEVTFPLTDEGPERYGLYWDDDGLVLEGRDGRTELEFMELVELGQGRYRIAVPDLFSVSRLDWGDEFVGVLTGERQVTIQKVVLPRRYRHFHLMMSGPMDPDSELARLVHRCQGAWATAAVGMWTLTVPVSMVDEFTAGASGLGLPLDRHDDDAYLTPTRSRQATGRVKL
ncbi:hypothetical protein ACWA7J_05775 [Leptothrix sp. BB-4]